MTYDAPSTSGRGWVVSRAAGTRGPRSELCGFFLRVCFRGRSLFSFYPFTPISLFKLTFPRAIMGVADRRRHGESTTRGLPREVRKFISITLGLGRVPWKDGAQGLKPVFGRDLGWGMVEGEVVRRAEASQCGRWSPILDAIAREALKCWAVRGEGGRTMG